MKNIKMLEINQLINLQKKSIIKSIIIIAKIEINLHTLIKIIKNNKNNQTFKILYKISNIKIIYKNKNLFQIIKCLCNK